jgi:hypothetical protein
VAVCEGIDLLGAVGEAAVRHWLPSVLVGAVIRLHSEVGFTSKYITQRYAHL